MKSSGRINHPHKSKNYEARIFVVTSICKVLFTETTSVTFFDNTHLCTQANSTNDFDKNAFELL